MLSCEIYYVINYGLRFAWERKYPLGTMVLKYFMDWLYVRAEKIVSLADDFYRTDIAYQELTIRNPVDCRYQGSVQKVQFTQ